MSAGSPGRVEGEALPLPTSSVTDRESERLARLELSLMTEPGHPRLAELVTTHGGVDAREWIRNGDGRCPPGWRVALGSADLTRRAERLLVASEDTDRRWVCPGDDEWPSQLDDLVHLDPLQDRGGVPLGLWVRGPQLLPAMSTAAVAVVGSRACTEYGAQIAGDIGADCAERQLPVVSGAAFGIDAAAHRGALALSGLTVAVLACGVDVAYPTAHQPMIERIAAEGLVVSEVCPGTRPSRVRFLARNRVIAAIASGTVVVEAARRSGALNTLNWAARLGRQTMGVPGPVTSSTSVGVHQVIRDGGAVLVTSGSEVVEMVAPLGSDTVGWIAGEHRPTDALGADELAVLEAVPSRRAAGIATIASDARVGMEEAITVLGRLMYSGWVERTGDGWRLTRQAAERLRHR
ncbi:MAG TPA: DNA-processing protein DprA [Nocardioidaceae bacterium]|nr:DNA-processing protein DprA [Nocardioidaceae bacterium]